LEVGITGHKVWLQLAEGFLRRRLKCEMLTDGRKVMAGELKMIKNVPKTTTTI
jgi:hypothetical protein